MITTSLTLEPSILNQTSSLNALAMVYGNVSNTISSTKFVAMNWNLSAGLSNFIVSINIMSNPHVILLQADGLVRVNFGNLPSATSHASAGFQFQDLFAIVGSDISSFPAFHFANSTASARNVNFFMAQYIDLNVFPDPLNLMSLYYFEPWNTSGEEQPGCIAPVITNFGFESGATGWTKNLTGTITYPSTIFGISPTQLSAQAFLGTRGDGGDGSPVEVNTLLGTNFSTVNSSVFTSGSFAFATAHVQTISAQSSFTYDLTFDWDFLTESGNFSTGGVGTDGAFFTINYTSASTAPDDIVWLARIVPGVASGGINLTPVPVASAVPIHRDYTFHTAYSTYSYVFSTTTSNIILGFGVADILDSGGNAGTGAGLLLDNIEIICHVTA